MRQYYTTKCIICGIEGKFIYQLCSIHLRLKRLFPKEFKKLEKQKISNL